MIMMMMIISPMCCLGFPKKTSMNQLFEISSTPKDHAWCYFQHHGQTLASVCLTSQIPFKFLTVIQPGLFTKSKSLENLLLQKISK